MTKNASGGLTDFTEVGGLDPAVDEMLKDGRRKRREARLPVGERKKIAKERRKSRTRRGRRAVYDLEPELIAAVRKLAEKHRVPASQIAAVLLRSGMQAFEQGEVDLEALKVPSESPRYDWNLDLERL